MREKKMRKKRRPNVWQIIGTALLAGGFFWFSLPLFVQGFVGIGMVFGWGICLVLTAALWAFPAMIRARRGRGFAMAGSLLCLLGVMWMGILTGLMLSAAGQTPPDSAAVLVLGCKVNGDGSPSYSLQKRIDRAYAYLTEHPQAVVIATGGQGENEPARECDVIRQGLIEKGISPDRILTEGDSYDTEQNMENCARLLEEYSLGNEVAVVTDNTHAYRACRIAEKYGLIPYAQPAAFDDWFLPAGYGRELLSLTLFFLENL